MKGARGKGERVESAWGVIGGADVDVMYVGFRVDK